MANSQCKCEENKRKRSAGLMQNGVMMPATDSGVGLGENVPFGGGRSDGSWALLREDEHAGADRSHGRLEKRKEREKPRMQARS